MQVFDGQGLPQPSSAPWHLFAQLAMVQPASHFWSLQLLLAVAQFSHAPPPVPQAPGSLPALQVVPSQQPLPQIDGSHFASPVQLPLSHFPPAAPQSRHPPPVAPHARSSVPSSQLVPLQQPGQLPVGQVPLQPSSAPAHFPAHFGSHPEVLHCPPAVHCFPTSAQSVQSSPPRPHAPPPVPGLHSPRSQQPGQLWGLHVDGGGDPVATQTPRVRSHRASGPQETSVLHGLPRGSGARPVHPASHTKRITAAATAPRRRPLEHRPIGALILRP